MKVLLPVILLFSLNSLGFAEKDNKQVSDLINNRIFYSKEMKTLNENSKTSLGFEAHYQGLIEIGFGFNTGNNGYNFPKLNVINGFRINPSMYLGFGTGLRLFLDNNAIFNSFAVYPVIPFFVDFRANLPNKNVSPYFALDFGYSIDPSDKFAGLGFMLNPTTGLAFPISDNIQLNIGIGYDMQWVKGSGSDGATVNLGAISVNTGFTF